MFKKKGENDFGILETIIGPESTFQGTIKSKNSVRIDGKLEGGVAEANGVIIGEKGQVQGDINARNVIVGGKITGNLTATHNLEILPKAQVYGDIHTALLSIGEGATFEGNCVMSTEKNKVIEMDIENRRH
ncbi:MAG: polymer-forming cytoskeletal protein [Endomicrobiales bacterium]|nr:polymer-forming cytoskeletal protein [Endomicrobiales bacterium]